MQTTHCYRRPLKQGGTTFDAYDSLAEKYPTKFPTVEYWTNGTSTHLQIMSSNSSSSPTTTTTTTQRRLTMMRRTTTTRKGGIPPSSTQQQQDPHVVRNSLLAGTVAGICSTALMYPAEVLRTKMQAAAAHHQPASHHAHSTRPFQVLLHTLEHGGIRALYTGLSLPLKAQAVYKATVFTVNNCTMQGLLEWKKNEMLKVGKYHPEEPPTLSLLDRFVCGAVGGAVNGALFVTPVEYVRNTLIAQDTRLAAAKSAGKTLASNEVVYRGPRHVLQHTIATQGWSKLYTGIGMTVARDSWGCGVFFVTFKVVSDLLTGDDDHRSKHPTVGKLAAGAAAGLGYWVAALPLDTLKTWVQNGTAESASKVLRELVHENGILGTFQRLTRAWKIAFGRGMPAAAVTMTSYEYTYKHFQQM
jgi:hypothetical protein